MARWGYVAAAVAMAVQPALPAWASVKDGVDAWSRGDFTGAVAQWQKPAGDGDADAQFNLAQAYKQGKGVAPNLERAEAFYLRAAKQGHLQAADAYGLLLFQTGRRETAMPWLRASAERGEPRAQYVLAVAHYNGDLAPKDPVRAYALMTRASASGLETARATLATMDQTMPLDQRQKGIALAAELERKADAQRATQMLAQGLGSKVPPSPSLAIPPITAGADFANPVTIGRPVKAVASTPKVAAAMPRAAPSAAGPANGAWRIQLGAFGVPGNAQALWAKLKDNAALGGHQAFYVPGGKLTRLQAGPFASRGEAEGTCAKLGVQACIPVQ